MLIESDVIQISVAARLTAAGWLRRSLLEHIAPSRPLLELVEAPLDNGATLVALLLLAIPVDPPIQLLGTVRDMVAALGDGCRDPTPAKPSPVRLRGIPLVQEHLVGAGFGSALPDAGDAGKVYSKRRAATSWTDAERKACRTRARKHDFEVPEKGRGPHAMREAWEQAGKPVPKK